MTEILLQTIKYVSSANMFWGVLGFTTAMGMFIGAMLYDGQINQAKKGILSVFSYMGMIGWMTLSRLSQTLDQNRDFPNTTHPEYAFASTVTTLFVTLAWVLGVFLGVLVFQYKYRGRSVE